MMYKQIKKKSSFLYNKILLENKNDFWDDVQNIKK